MYAIRSYYASQPAAAAGTAAEAEVADPASMTARITSYNVCYTKLLREVKAYPCGHFDVYLPPLWDQVVADQTEFLLRHLAPHGPGTDRRQRRAP